MISVHFSNTDLPFVWASDLHTLLEIKTKLSTWFPRMIEYGFEEDKDYMRRHKNVPSAGTIEKDSFDWAITIEMAKHIAMMQKTPKGKEIRDYLLNLDKKVTDGEFLNQQQIMALFDICKVMGYFSVQEYFEREHYEKIFKESSVNWWEERARLFGYTAQELQKALADLGVKYKNQRQAIYKLDRNDLIRIGVVDLFRSMGKSKAYALNVGNIAKIISKELKPFIYNDINTAIDFKSEEQTLIITDLKNYKSVGSGILQKFTNKPQTTPVKSGYNQLDLRLNSN
ncbi:MAG: phage antirepressor Ant [Mucilaginibacter sp.]